MQRVCHCNWEFCWRCLPFRLPDSLTKDQIQKLSDAEKCDISLKLHLKDWNADFSFYRVCKKYPLTPTQIPRVAMWALEQICDNGFHNPHWRICLEMLQSPHCDILSFGGFASKLWILNKLGRIRLMHGSTIDHWVIDDLFNEDLYNTLKTQKRMTMNARNTAIYVVMAFRFIVSRDISRLIGRVVYNTRGDEEWNFKMKDSSIKIIK